MDDFKALEESVQREEHHSGVYLSDEAIEATAVEVYHTPPWQVKLVTRSFLSGRVNIHLEETPTDLARVYRLDPEATFQDHDAIERMATAARSAGLPVVLNPTTSYDTQTADYDGWNFNRLSIVADADSSPWEVNLPPGF